MEASSKKRLTLLIVLLAACGAAFAWVLTRGDSGPKIEDETAQKANRLTEKAVEASDEAQQRESPMADEPPPNVTDMRNQGSGG